MLQSRRDCYSNDIRASSKKQREFKLVELLSDPYPEKAKPRPRMDNINKKELGFYDPPYLEREGPFPQYEKLKLSIKSYDYLVLENYFEYMKTLCKKLNVKCESYPMPSRTLRIKTYQTFGSNVDKEYSLSMYERVVDVSELKSTLAPVLFEVIQLNLPEGVQFKVGLPTLEEDDFRYVPDILLDDKRKELEELNKNKN